MTEILVASLLVNLAAGVLSFTLQERLQRWRRERPYMVYLTAVIFLSVAGGALVLSRFASSATFRFIPRAIQIPIPHFILPAVPTPAQGSILSALLATTAFFTLSLTIGIIAPILNREAPVGDRLTRLDVAYFVNNGIQAFAFILVIITSYRFVVLSQNTSKVSISPFSVLLVINFSGLALFFSSLAIPARVETRGLWISSLVIGSLSFGLLAIVVMS